MSKLAVGVMSGTSGDGVSFALCSFKGRSFELHQYKTFDYPAVLAKELLSGLKLTAPQISRLNVTLGKFFADRLLKFLKTCHVSSTQIAVVGSHGHTIYHGGSDHPLNTLQIGEPSFMSEAAGIPVVADFRVRDLAAGGSGAPLISFFDHYFFGSGKPRALQNIGGIGNVTLAGKKVRGIAFDTGPGNCLIDWAVQKMTKGRMKFDRGGHCAACGTIDMGGVQKMATHPYFNRKPPKSTGRELFNENFIPASLKRQKSEDLLATLTYFTAYSIKLSYERFLPKTLSEIMISGGGALNLTLMNHLKKLFSPVPVRSIGDYGIPVQAKEPMAFAFFALRALEGKINHWPEGTGAKKAAVLGKIIPGILGPGPIKALAHAPY